MAWRAQLFIVAALERTCDVLDSTPILCNFSHWNGRSLADLSVHLDDKWHTGYW